MNLRSCVGRSWRAGSGNPGPTSRDSQFEAMEIHLSRCSKRSEEPRFPRAKMLRFAQHDRPSGFCPFSRAKRLRQAASALGVVALFLVALGTSCGQPAAPPAPVLLRLAGSTSMQPLVRELASAYSARVAHVSFESTPLGSTAGLEALRRGSADLALLSRPVDAREEVDISTGKRALSTTVIAVDAVAVIVHGRNPIHNLSSYQLRNLFEGQIPRWDEAGGTAHDVIVVSREDGSGTRAVFETAAMRGHRVTSTALVMPSSEAVRDYVAAHQEAIGYVSIGWLAPGVVALAIDGATASRESVERGTYPLVRPFIVVSRSDANSDVSEFLAFITSPSGQAIVRRVYAGPGAARQSQ